MRRACTPKPGTVELIYTDADFENLSWHDCHIHGVEFHVGNADDGDWTSELVLDIDYIVEWICGRSGGGQFRVAPATLVFHEVTDLKIAIDWGSSGFRSSLHVVSIGSIERELLPARKGHSERPYYSWRVRLNWPESGEIAFGAVGFTHTLRAEPVLTKQQSLPFRVRSRVRGP
jgi:hypothetical protein